MSSTKEALGLFREGALVLALVLYGVVRISTEAFCGALGTTPEEVGLSYLTVVARAAIGVVALGAPLIAATLLYGWWMNRMGEKASREQGPALPLAPRMFRRRRLWAFLAMLFVAACMYFLGYDEQVTTLMVAVALVPVAVVLRGLIRLPRDGFYQLAAVFALTLSLAGVAFAGMEAGRWKANAVKAGREVASDPMFGVVPVSASCVEVTWLRNPSIRPPELTGADLMYLGQAQSTLILYWVDEDALVRVPSADAVVTDRDCD